jgi:hypothetical protein
VVEGELADLRVRSQAIQVIRTSAIKVQKWACIVAIVALVAMYCCMLCSYF